MTDLETYQELVNKSADNRSSNVIPNAGEIHAGIVMSKLFEKAEKSVHMVVGSLDGKVSNQANYISGLESCVAKNIPIKILFLDPPNRNSTVFSILKSKKNSEGYPVEFKLATSEVKQKHQFNGEFIHYSVFDDDKYRIEKDVKKYLAWVCFNDPINAALLNIAFNSSFDKSSEIEL